MRKPIIAGNWKMNKTVKEAQELVRGLIQKLKGIRNVEIVVCPPFTALREVSRIIPGTNIRLGAQDVYWQDSGAYTGEVSCPMLKELNCQYVIIGHSERRAYFGETNDSVNKKAKAVLAHQLTPIICVGERLAEREKGQTFAVIKDHIVNGLCGLKEKQAQNIIIAYEPVWAIGTGKTATPVQAQQAHSFIRNLLAELYSRELADIVRIQYGGSVRPDNITELIDQNDVDGALVGGASLELDAFVKIVKGAKR